MATKKAIKSMADLLESKSNQLVVPQKGETVKGKVSKIGKRSLSVDIGAKTEGLVADKEFDVAKEFVSELKVGDEVEAVVYSTENDRGHILLSLKQAAFDAKWQLFKDALEKGSTVEVRGLEVNKGGLIVVAHGIRGFIPSSQFSKSLAQEYSRLRGKAVEVKVIEVDQEKNRLIFSERHVSEADEIAKRQKALDGMGEGLTCEAKVSGVMPFGLFATVQLPVGKDAKDSIEVEGLVHISEISWEKVDSPKDYHKEGDTIKVRVLGLDEQTGKLNLSIKQLSDDPWKDIEKRYPTGTTFTGEVTRVEPFGAFIHVEEGVDGLMHSSKMERGKQYEKGEEVQVSVESVDSKERRMSLAPVLTELPVDYK